MTMTHDDINRSLGRVEGEMRALHDRLDRLEAFFEESMREIKESLKRLETRADAQDALEQRRKGAAAVIWPAITAISAAVSIAATWLLNHFIK